MASKKNTKKSATKGKKSVEELYKKVEHIEHVLLRPDTYVGSIEEEEVVLYVANDDGQMVKRNVKIVPGLYKIFDEVLVNAMDHAFRLIQKDSGAIHQVSTIKVDIKDGAISVYNDGDGIPVVIHEEEGVYVPEMIFGQLLTSGNYDDDEERTVGGRNGYGAKLANIFSTEFTVETVDANEGLKFKQTHTNNMSSKNKPKITTNSGKPWTRITFRPDLARFGLKTLTKDMIALFKKRTYDAAACTPEKVNVYWNGKKIVLGKGKKTKFEKYVNLYLDSDTPRAYTITRNGRWEVVATMSPDLGLEHVSFVNGIYTYKGGKHVKHVSEGIAKALAKKKKGLKWTFVRDNMWIFLRSTIINPSFTSQVKAELDTDPKKFGSKFEPTDAFIKKLANCGILERAEQLGEFKEKNQLKKADGRKTRRICVPKLDDANKAGTAESAKCTLILTEGDSAKTLAVAGMGVVGRDYYGAFPLRGKLLNVRDASPAAVAKNAEICNIIQILGLKQGKKYTSDNVSELRYGRVMIMTDQDVDGAHIKGLLLNFFDHFWPTLLKDTKFVCSMITPIVRVSKGKGKKKKEESFYTLQDFEAWQAANNGGRGWAAVYYKGLGSSDTREAKLYFKNLDKTTIYYPYDDDAEAALYMAFANDKKRQNTDDRKRWLGTYDPQATVSGLGQKVPVSAFVNRELIHFSMEDNLRSIPSLLDGLKPGTRKPVYVMLMKKITNAITVASFTGKVMDEAAYHHGEVSLQGSIIGLAQDFIGANNINLFFPQGQFGSRQQGGKDAASARYIKVYMTRLMQYLYPEVDTGLLEKMLDDNGGEVEPRHFIPVLPMVLVNGAEGIGTGYSTKVPQFNPKDIAANLERLMDDEELVPMKPWYRGFRGTIEATDAGNYTSSGIYQMEDSKTIRITELPLGIWIQDYKEHLESLLASNKDSKRPDKDRVLKDYVLNNGTTTNRVDISLTFDAKTLAKLLKDREVFEKIFKMKETKKLQMGNMHLFDQDGLIQRFESPEDILRAYYRCRIDLYATRREHLIGKLEKELDMNAAKVKFIEGYLAGKIPLQKIDPDEELKALLKKMELPKFPKPGSGSDKKSYSYLTDMPIVSITPKRLEKLRQERDMKLSELNDIRGKTPQDLWRADLARVMNAYDEMMAEWHDMIEF